LIQDAAHIAHRATRKTGQSKTRRPHGEPQHQKTGSSRRPESRHSQSQTLGLGSSAALVGSRCDLDSDRFEWCQSDLTEDRRVPVLITFPSAEAVQEHSDGDGAADSLGDSCKHCPLIPQDERLELPLINGFSTYVEPEQLDELAEYLPEGTSMTLNHPIRYPMLDRLLASDTASMMEISSAGGRVERLPNIEKVWEQGFKGQGQRIVIIDSGIHPHPDLADKVVEWVDFSKAKKPKPLDEYGHGTHVAGLAAGSGVKSNGEISGIAPEAELVGLRITTVAEAIKALQWCVENKDSMNLKVINMSLGEVARRGHKFDPWALAVQKATEAGLVVCVAAGNEGPNPGSISTPGIYPGAITVGAYDSKGTPDPSDDTVWKNSSQGPTIDNVAKPDVLAPGVSIFGPLAPGAALDNAALPHRDKDYFAISGTSQATPMIAGLASILLQADPTLDAEGIKAIMKKASGKAPIHPASGKPAMDGAGLVDAHKALQLALAGRPESAVA
jgi:subtilisin family serine protease